QQVLAYMNVPHDVDVQDPRRMFLRAHAKEDDVSEGAPDYIASEQGSQGVDVPPAPSPAPAPALPPQNTQLRTVAATSKPEPQPSSPAGSPVATVPAQPASSKAPEQVRGTVVLDVAGGVPVPDFRGKSLRAALEEAESAGLELEISGSGVGQT